MAHKGLTLALGMIVVAAPPAHASAPVPAPGMTAPAGTPSTRYCMRVELTGNIIEPVRCWTRAEWADQGIDVDLEWAKEGVGIIG